jgi:hypothetical protein
MNVERPSPVADKLTILARGARLVSISYLGEKRFAEPKLVDSMHPCDAVSIRMCLHGST